jgi:hypothetical protein
VGIIGFIRVDGKLYDYAEWEDKIKLLVKEKMKKEWSEKNE